MKPHWLLRVLLDIRLPHRRSSIDHPRRRDQDKGARFWIPWTYRHLIPAIAIGLAAWTVISVDQDQKNFQNKIQNEARDRRDQTCLIFERQQKIDVLTLRRTYHYLVGLSDHDRRMPLNSAIFAQLPTIEDDAHLDDAPRYCDTEDLGLPEPDLKIPKRPKVLNKYI